MELQTHLLHGLIHCNGFGHLVCINGIEGGSKTYVADKSWIYGIEFAQYFERGGGYRFCCGSFGVAEHYYISAIELLSSLELEVIIEDFGKTDKGREIKQIIRHYRDMSETQLVTIKDLLRFMLTIKSRAPMLINKVTSSPPSSITRPPSRLSTKSKPLRKEKSTAYRRFSTVVACMGSRWPTRRLESTAEVIVDALKENQAHGGMTRQDLRDAARLHIGNTGLLDHVLKAMNNVIVGNHVVRRTVTQSLEFWNIPSVRGSHLVELATQAILESKHFAKEWPFVDAEDQYLRFICRLVPRLCGTEAEMKMVLPVGEIVVVPMHATVGELKQAVENALKDTYCITDEFDEELLFGAVESGAELCVRGIGIGLENRLRYEGGADNWVVKCECGAQDDDGERMVECDLCEVWQHTRCCGIEDTETVPPLFVCSGCCASLVPPKTDSSCGLECSPTLLTPIAVRTEANMPLELEARHCLDLHFGMQKMHQRLITKRELN
ncbi:phd finger protein [Quercus suber]|uniref:Phd finger protein n=1 Tax=Quercus suber TaxID=58331 RepID=A0AAW0IY93_QUESU